MARIKIARDADRQDDVLTAFGTTVEIDGQQIPWVRSLAVRADDPAGPIRVELELFASQGFEVDLRAEHLDVRILVPPGMDLLETTDPGSETRRYRAVTKDHV